MANCRFSLVLVALLVFAGAVVAQSPAARDAFKAGLACPETDYDCKIDKFTQVIELEPTIAEVYIERGVAYRKKSQNDLALADLNKAFEHFNWVKEKGNKTLSNIRFRSKS